MTEQLTPREFKKRVSRRFPWGLIRRLEGDYYIAGSVEDLPPFTCLGSIHIAGDVNGINITAKSITIDGVSSNANLVSTDGDLKLGTVLGGYLQSTRDMYCRTLAGVNAQITGKLTANLVTSDCILTAGEYQIHRDERIPRAFIDGSTIEHLGSGMIYSPIKEGCMVPYELLQKDDLVGVLTRLQKQGANVVHLRNSSADILVCKGRAKEGSHVTGLQIRDALKTYADTHVGRG